MDSAVGRGVVGPLFEPHPCLLFLFCCRFHTSFFSIKKALLSSPDRLSLALECWERLSLVLERRERRSLVRTPGTTILSVRTPGTTILRVKTPGTTILRP